MVDLNVGLTGKYVTYVSVSNSSIQAILQVGKSKSLLHFLISYLPPFLLLSLFVLFLHIPEWTLKFVPHNDDFTSGSISLTPHVLLRLTG